MMTDTTVDEILIAALRDVIATRHEQGVYGFILNGMDNVPVEDLLELLGNPAEVFVSVIGSEKGPELLDWAKRNGRDALNFGIGATHAVRVRNDAPEGAIKVAIVMREEERLHSLTKRGYQVIGPQQVIRRLCELGAQRAPNDPQRNLWKALGSPRLAPFLPLDGVLHFYRSFALQKDANPRELLPHLGLLRDSRLLAGSHLTVESITKRLIENANMVERLQRADEEDRRSAVTTIHTSGASEQVSLRESYNAFLRIARNELDALTRITLPAAEELLKGNPINPDPKPEPEPEPETGTEPEAGTDTSKSRRHRPFDDLTTAAVELTLEGRNGLVGSLVRQAKYILANPDAEGDRLWEEEVVVQFDPEDRAAAIGKVFASEGRYGGTIKVSTQPLDETLQHLAGFVHSLEPYDPIELQKLKELLQRVRERLLPTFEGAKLLEEYLQARASLLEYASILAVYPLACLIGDSRALEIVRQLIEAYERLLSHLDENLIQLRGKSREGAALIHNQVLALDMIHVYGEDDMAIMVSPLNPLALWKYAELASLAVTRGGDLPPSDRDLLLDQINDLPEPLLAVYNPKGVPNEATELGFAGRIGSMPVYRPVSYELADLSHETISLAGRKLAALYPAIKKDLRILLVDPISLHEAAKAVKTLTRDASGGFEHVTVVVTRTRRAESGISSAEDRTMDELFERGQIELEVAGGVQSPRQLAASLAKRPVHLLGLAGDQRKDVELIMSEETRLHPLSLPRRLYADPLMGTVSLRPRSVKPAEGNHHPFGLYHSLVSNILENPRFEYSIHQSRPLTVQDCLPLLPQCQFLLVSGDSTKPSNAEVLRLGQGSGLLGDSVLTGHVDRIIDGIDTLLRRLNYQPSKESLRRLLDRLQEIGGDGLFATISEKETSGFSEAALHGQLGLAVALDWYKTRQDTENQTVVSLDSPLARRWLQKRPEEERADLIGFRQDADGATAIDVIEVKSYKATGESSVDPGHPARQLRSVGQVIYDMLHHQGDILIDRRRELLRLQVYREALAGRVPGNPDWIETLNGIIDGNNDVNLNLVLVELTFEQNIPFEEQILHPVADSTSPVDSLPIHRYRLGERDIAPHLEGLVQRMRPDLAKPSNVEESQLGPTTPTPVGQEQQVEEPSQAGETAVPSTVEPEKRPGPEPATADKSEPASEEIGFEPSIAESETIATMARNIYRVLRDIGIRLGDSVDPKLADVGPSVVRFKVRLQVGEKVSALQGRARDLMRELATEKEPIIDNLPNTNFVFIDLPRPMPKPAHMRPFLNRLQAPQGSDGLWCPVGVTPDGKVEQLDLTTLPHMLVAGSTGSGKTMFLYSLIVGLTKLYGAKDLQLILIDPKQTDFVFFSRLPHLGGKPIITDPKDAINALMRLLTDQLQERTTILTNNMCRDIRSYNARYPSQRIAPILVMIDEFADLADVMDKQERENFDQAMRRLAQRARNVGIHLVVATQRPTTDIVNGNLKSNLPCRVSFRLASAVDSRTVLDQGGAEHLLGNGDMLLSWNGRVTRLQGFFLPEPDLLAVLGLNQ